MVCVKNTWLRRYEVLKSFYSECHRFPKYNESYGRDKIGSWFHLQRSLYKSGRLSVTRVKKLCEINECWYKSEIAQKSPNSWRNNVMFNEHPLDIIVKDTNELNKYILEGVYSVESYYSKCLIDKNLVGCTDASEVLFPNIPFYYLRLLSVLLNDKSFLDLDNLCIVLSESSQRSIKSIIGCMIRELPNIAISILNLRFRDGVSIDKISKHLKLSKEKVESVLVDSLSFLSKNRKLSRVKNILSSEI